MCLFYNMMVLTWNGFILRCLRSKPIKPKRYVSRPYANLWNRFKSGCFVVFKRWVRKQVGTFNPELSCLEFK